MEKRRYPRKSLRVPAFFSSHTLKNVLCAITDFCNSGVCIQVIDTDDLMLSNYVAEQDVLQVNLGPAAENLKVFGLVVRITRSSIGLRVLEDEEHFLNRLKQLLNEQDRVYDACLNVQHLNTFDKPKVTAPSRTREEKPMEFSEEFKEVCRDQDELAEEQEKGQESEQAFVADQYNIDLPHELAAIITKYIRYSLRGTFTQTVESMRAMSKHVKQKSVADEIEARHLKLHEETEGLVQLMLDDCLMELWVFFNPEDAANSSFAFNFSSDTLEVLGEEVLDSWVVMKTFGNEYEKENQSLLTEIEIRVSYLMGKHIKPGNLPFSPSSFCTRYYALVSKLKLEEDAQALLMKIFERHFLLQIDKLYKAINNALKEKGVLPNIKESKAYRDRVERSVVNHFSSRKPLI